MAEKYLILSDIHGNVGAFDAVLADCCGEEFAGVILLGDAIDYGMRSDDIIKKINYSVRSMGNNYNNLSFICYFP